MREVCKKWLGETSKFHIGVSDNAANVTLALNSSLDLEAPVEIRNAPAALEDLDESDDDDDCFPVLTPMHVGSAGCFAHLLNLLVEVNFKYIQCQLQSVYARIAIRTFYF